MKKKVSIVVPCYNEEDNIEEFYCRLSDTISKVKSDFDWELIFVDDGSRDNTLQKILDLYNKDKRIKIIEFSRNFGKEIALTAGLDYATGDVVIPIDADLQDPPEVILRLLEKCQEGFDIVNAKRATRTGDSLLKKFFAALFYKTINILSDIEIPSNVGDFRLISRDALEALKKLKERRRFMKGLFAWIGFKSTYITYNHEPRFKGKSHWNFMKLVNLALEGITSFSIKPLKIATYMGLLISSLSFIYVLYIIIKTLIYGNPVKGYPSLIVVILFLGGVQLISLGILGEYIGRIYEEVKQRPLYIVKNYYNDNRANQGKHYR